MMLASDVTSRAAVTYNKQIAPILLEHCASCHRPGEAGGFSLLTYADARKRARLIRDVTQRRYMPPWLPEFGFGEFTGENRLTDIQIAQIREWVSSGTPEGSPSDAPPAPVFTTGWQLGTPDLIVTIGKPFRVAAEGPDVFWNFVLSPAMPRSRYIKSVEVRPGNAQSVHHANLLLDRTRSSRHQEKIRGEGFAGMELNIETPTFDPDSHFLFWKPGGPPWVEPRGLAWRLDPGNDLVLNVHFHPTGKAELVQPSVGLYFTDDPPSELPMLLQIEHDSLLDIAPGQRDFLVAEDFRLPVDATVLAVYPHAHYLGRLLEAYATLPDGTRQWLIRIPDWDINWQAVFHYKTPLHLPKGTVVSMRFHYDNSAQNPRNPNVPPKRVTAGNQSTDEMGHLWLQLLVGDNSNRMLLQESLMSHRLELDSSNATAHFNLGALLLGRKEYADAVPQFRDALATDPKQPMALNNLGAALLGLGKFAEAEEQFQQALRVDPDYSSARFNLANALAGEGKLRDAAAGYRKVLSVDPSDNAARERLVALLVRMGNEAASAGQFADAAACYRELVGEHPDDPDFRNNFGIILARLGDLPAAAAQFEAALEANPAHTAARKNLEAIRKRMGQP
ncbi:MAG TPA: tetratricopeptide repeat protein [Bryobacteraceae bacterium]|jgi:tetratricopeptide (TPR) repeat protein